MNRFYPDPPPKKKKKSRAQRQLDFNKSQGYNMTGEQAKSQQRAINNLSRERFDDFTSIDVDGYYGQDTQAAIKRLEEYEDSEFVGEMEYDKRTGQFGPIGSFEYIYNNWQHRNDPTYNAERRAHPKSMKQMVKEAAITGADAAFIGAGIGAAAGGAPTLGLGAAPGALIGGGIGFFTGVGASIAEDLINNTDNIDEAMNILSYVPLATGAAGLAKAGIKSIPKLLKGFRKFGPKIYNQAKNMLSKKGYDIGKVSENILNPSSAEKKIADDISKYYKSTRNKYEGKDFDIDKINAYKPDVSYKKAPQNEYDKLFKEELNNLYSKSIDKGNWNSISNVPSPEEIKKLVMKRRFNPYGFRQTLNYPQYIYDYNEHRDNKKYRK